MAKQLGKINSNTKGKVAERYFAKNLRPLFPSVITTRSSQAYNGGLDLYYTEPFGFEIKAVKSFQNQPKHLINKWFRELDIDAKRADNKYNTCTYPVLLYKPFNGGILKSRLKDDLVFMRLETFEGLDLKSKDLESSLHDYVFLKVGHKENTYLKLVETITKYKAVEWQDYYICFFNDFYNFISEMQHNDKF